jgi:hypothetical protein
VSRSGLQDEPDAAGLHAAGLLGTRPRRTWLLLTDLAPRASNPCWYA